MGDECFEVLALACGAVDIAGVTVTRVATVLMNPARSGGTSGDCAASLGVRGAATDLPTGKQRIFYGYI